MVLSAIGRYAGNSTWYCRLRSLFARPRVDCEDGCFFGLMIRIMISPTIIIISNSMIFLLVVRLWYRVAVVISLSAAFTSDAIFSIL